MRDLDDEKRIKEYMAAKMKHIKMYNECMNLADGLDVAKFAELVRADERAKREWVGLTEERVEYLADKYAPPIHPAFTKDDDYWRFYQEIELELKEKNHAS